MPPPVEADVGITRLAADALGATKMERPEWGAVDPLDGRVYFTLTNNARRTEAQLNGPTALRRDIKWTAVASFAMDFRARNWG